jgi:hypothetical protein
MSPFNPAGSVSDLLINVISVGFGFIEVGLIDISNLSQVGDNFGRDLFVGGVLLVSGYLGLKVLGF